MAISSGLKVAGYKLKVGNPEPVTCNLKLKNAKRGEAGRSAALALRSFDLVRHKFSLP
jgi:hypothetical protein